MGYICRENAYYKGFGQMGKNKRIPNAIELTSKTSYKEEEQKGSMESSDTKILGLLDVEIPPPPCEVYSCLNRDRCADELLACNSFLNFLNTGKNDGRPSFPTRLTYRKCFYEPPYNNGKDATPDGLSLLRYGEKARDELIYYDMTSEEAEIQGKQFFDLYTPLKQSGVKNPLLYLAKSMCWNIGFVYKGVKRGFTILNKLNKKELDSRLKKELQDLLKARQNIIFNLSNRPYFWSTKPPTRRKYKNKPKRFKHDYRRSLLKYNEEQLKKLRVKIREEKNKFHNDFNKLSNTLISEWIKGKKLLENEEKRKVRGNY